MNGYIKLFRKMTEWEWYKDVPTFKVFMHLLIVANREDGTFQGIKIKRGQRLTSRSHLAEETGLTERQVRTALKHLEMTNEVSIKTSNKCTIITVGKYNDYQDCMNTSDQQNDQRSDHPSDHKQEDKKIEDNKEKSTTYSKRKSEVKPKNQIPPTVEMVREYCESRHNNIDAEQFCDFYTSKNWMVGKDKMKDWQASVRTWERNHGTNGNNQSAGRSAPRVTDEERRSIEEWEAEQRALFSQG